ncbi:MAG: glycoside hydrolase family 31 protein [Armatimonadota bacterium]
MKQTNRFINDMLDFDMPETANDVLWRACKPVSAEVSGSNVILKVPFKAQKRGDSLTAIIPDDEKPAQLRDVIIRAYGDSVVRVTLAVSGEVPGDESVMLEWDKSLLPDPLTVDTVDSGWNIIDSRGTIRMKLTTKDEPRRTWGGQEIPFAIPESFVASVLPDGRTEIPFMAYDQFFPGAYDSMALSYVERDEEPIRTLFSVHAEHNEKFAGTGERFAKTDLSGRTLILENMDGMGVNNRKCYKNMPFYVSSKPYGLLMLTSAHIRLSLADISTRASQAMIEDPMLDLFFIGGGSIEQICLNYRRITGFPHNVPLWSYGTWMSRMTYFTPEETYEVADKMREGKFPCDVIHLDTAWFEENWKCDWEFSKTKFPDPAGYMQNMRDRGFRISLWQLPTIGKDNKLWDIAKEKGYIAPKKTTAVADASNFGGLEYAGTIDFSNPETVEWYQGMLKKLFEIGASAIKTDFGEEIDMEADYKGMPARLLHNLYALLYQKAAYEITEKTTGEGLIWARASWIGSQRYPVHWGGDTACTWDGLAGTIRGGLHIGLSGFGFWSHDVPGFHGIPGFLDTWPANDLYVRWTQVGVFTSHLRYHGGQPREPYEYPEIAPIVRKWLNFRYSLIPYLVDQAKKVTETGYPIFRSMLFHHGDDPMCWNIDDQFYCGDNLLVAPVINSEDKRDIYLPEGEWVDIWIGKTYEGNRLLKNFEVPLSRIPVFAVKGSAIKVYPEIVQCTDEMDLANSVELVFDDSYKGFNESILGASIGEL